VRPRSADAAARLDSELIGLGDKEFAELISWFASRLQPFLRTPALREILGTGEDAVDMLSVIEKGENLIVDLASLELGEDIARVLGALWLLKVRQAMGRRKDRKRPVVLLVDEAHLYTFGALPGLLAEARKFGIGIVVATQAADNLTPRLARAIEANVGSAISLRTGINAANAASERLGGWPAMQLTRLEDLTAAASLSRGGMPTNAFTLHVDHFDVVEAEGWDAERIAGAAEASAEQSSKTLWAPYADSHVLDDVSVLGNVRASMERAPRQRPRPSTPATRTEAVLDELARRAQQESPITRKDESDEQPGTYDVVLLQRGDHLIQVVKEIREVTGLGLAESKKLADNVGGMILRDVPYPVAATLQHRLGLAGANARIVESRGVVVGGDA
jgi:ribosomal protein L7/L12